jgi:hypothetical protein
MAVDAKVQYKNFLKMNLSQKSSGKVILVG